MLIRYALVDSRFDRLATSNGIYCEHNHGAPNKDKAHEHIDRERFAKRIKANKKHNRGTDVLDDAYGRIRNSAHTRRKE